MSASEIERFKNPTTTLDKLEAAALYVALIQIALLLNGLDPMAKELGRAGTLLDEAIDEINPEAKKGEK